MLQVICGPMKAKKSKVLIERYLLDQKAGKRVKMFYPACCSRRDGYVTSRSGSEAKAIKVFEPLNILQYIGKIDAIYIDEVQFICPRSEQISDLMMVIKCCEKNKIDVYCAGLDLDFKAESFKVMSVILPYADVVEKRTAFCDKCGKEACRTARYVGNEPSKNTEDVLMMSNDDVNYNALCVHCYNELMGEVLYD